MVFWLWTDLALTTRNSRGSIGGNFFPWYWSAFSTPFASFQDDVSSGFLTQEREKFSIGGKVPGTAHMQSLCLLELTCP